MRRQVLVDKVTSLFSICTNYENCDWMNGRYIEHMQIVILKVNTQPDLEIDLETV